MPDDAAVVIVAGPKTDFFPPEIDALKKYLDKAGKLLLVLDPPDKADGAQLTNLIALAHDWGIDVGNDVVVDVSGMGRLIGTDASVPVVATYPTHPITERFNFVTAFPLARSVTPVPGGVNGHTAQPFAQTSAQSWAEADIKDMLATGKVALDEAKGDKKGPDHDCGRRVRRVDVARRRPADRTRSTRSAEARDACGGRRRFGLRGECRSRHSGQSRSVHEHDRLAVAAGEPDFDSAEEPRRSPDHADGDRSRATSRGSR